MRNILAIAGKELRGYFASPIAFVCSVSSRSSTAGSSTCRSRSSTARACRWACGHGRRDEHQLRCSSPPVLTNTTVLILFVMPMITMRTYAEEKRSGTIELLLTSPLTDLQIILGKFFGAMGLYAAMLAVTLMHIGLLFLYGNPAWKPVVTGYLGLILMGGCFLSVGLLISSLTKNQITAGMVTFAVFLMLWVINWIGSFVGPTAQAVLSHLSITDHFDDFARGVIDTKHLVYYLSFIAFGLFLTAKAVDSERWRG